MRQAQSLSAVQGKWHAVNCRGQLKLATTFEFFQYRFSDSFGVVTHRYLLCGQGQAIFRGAEFQSSGKAREKNVSTRKET